MSEVDNLTALVKNQGRAEAMTQAGKWLAALAAATNTWGTPEVQMALHYLSKGDFNASYGWRPPSQPTDIPKHTLKKFSNEAGITPLTIRYAVTPSGESRGDFVRVEMRRSGATNLIYCTSPDLRGFTVAEQQLGDCLAEVPNAIRRHYATIEDDIGVTVERVDWPEGHK